MDGFFDKYGRVIIIAVVICFVLLYLTPMRNVVGSSINGFAGNFANKVGDSLGTVKMPDGSGNVTWETPEGIEVGTRITIKNVFKEDKGSNPYYYIVEQTGDNKFLVIQDSSVYGHYNGVSCNSSKKGTEYYNIYENSDVDNYLEKVWYEGLTNKMQNAIELTEITQVSYNLNNYELDHMFPSTSLNKKYDTNYKGQKYNTLKRHVYLPSVDNMIKLDNVINLSRGMYTTRDTCHMTSDTFVEFFGGFDPHFALENESLGLMPEIAVGPAFIVDLSKVEYEV